MLETNGSEETSEKLVLKNAFQYPSPKNQEQIRVRFDIFCSVNFRVTKFSLSHAITFD